jgi:hypothetical protein
MKRKATIRAQHSIVVVCPETLTMLGERDSPSVDEKGVHRMYRGGYFENISAVIGEPSAHVYKVGSKVVSLKSPTKNETRTAY